MILHSGDGPLFVEVGLDVGTRMNGGFERALAEGWTLARLEREYVAAVLASTRGNRSRAARLLGINRSTLYEKLTRGDQPGPSLERPHRLPYKPVPT